MSHRYLRVEQDATGIVVVVLDDPASMNAVNHALNRELACELRRVDEDESARVLIVTGAGSVFCSGANVRTMAQTGGLTEPPALTLREELHPHEADIRAVTVGLRTLGKPSIAAINGHAIGSGLGIAAACDMRFAVRGAKLGWVFTRRGLIPDDGSLYFMPQIVGYARAFEWGITGRTIGPEEAERMGFLNAVLEPSELMAHCRAVATEIIENVPPLAAQSFKLAIVEAAARPMEAAILFGARAQEKCRTSADHGEAIRAFVEKRAPKWSGK